MNEIFNRYSVRKYKDQPIEAEKIDNLLKAAMQAPSAVNQQPWEFYVITNKELLDRLSEVSPYARMLKKAPAAIVLCNRKDTITKEYQQIDMAICSENILLQAVSEGLGAVMLGVAPLKDRMEFVQNLLDIPDSLEPFAIIVIGYPDEFRNPQNRYDENRIHYIK